MKCVDERVEHPTRAIAGSTRAMRRRVAIAEWLTSYGLVFCLAIPGLATLKGAIILLIFAYLILTERTTPLGVAWSTSCILSWSVSFALAMGRNSQLPWAINQLTRILFLMTLIAIGKYLAHPKGRLRISPQDVIYKAAFLSAAFKIAISIGGLANPGLVDQLHSALGFESVPFGLGFGLARLQFPTDIVMIFAPMIFTGKTGAAHRGWLFVASSGIVVALSFSRFMFAAFLLALLLRAVAQRKVDSTTIAGGVLIGICLTFAAGMLALRFSSELSADSDDARVVQMEALKREIRQRPLWGKGAGASATQLIRSETLPFSYEVEWFALVMQFGFFGVFWLLANIMAPMMQARRSFRDSLGLWSIVLLWIASGFTNPYIISLGSGFGLCLLLVRFPDVAGARFVRVRRRTMRLAGSS